MLAMMVMFACFLCVDAIAQTDLSSISGTITDSSGAVVPNCQIELKNVQTSAVRNAVTDARGFYSIPSLTLGNYTVTAAAAGFNKTISTISLTLSGATANLQLNVGNAAQQVTVNGGGSVALQTDSHEISVTVSSLQLTNLPNNGRSLINVATLGPASQPGSDFAAGGSGDDESFFNQQNNSVIIAGLGNNHTSFLQDGVENVNLLTQTANIVASVESAQEVNTILNSAPARFSQPAVVNVITKSGTNQFHGTAYDFLQNDAFDAKNWFQTSKAPKRYDLFGGNIGAPILRNRLFGFFDYSGLRSHTSSVYRDRVPTVAERGGDFSADPGTIYDPSTYNPATGTTTAFKENKISGPFSPFSQLWLANYPLPNVPLGADNINYIVNLPSTNNFDQYQGRVDWNISSKNQLFGTIARNSSTQVTPSISPGPFALEYAVSGTNATVEDTYVLSSNMVNVAKVGYNRSNVFREQEGAGALNYSKFYGLQNLNPTPAQWEPPQINVQNYASFGDPYSPDGAIQNRFQFADELNWKLGNHSIYLGGEFVRTQFDGTWVVGNNGIYSFTGAATAQYINGSLTANPAAQGNAFADLLLGYPLSANASTGTSVGAFRETQVAGYLQDDWRVSPNLTVNLGIRYDFDNPPIDKNGHSALFNVPEGKPVPGTWNTNYGDWGPRVGFAYSAGPKTVVRGGYGIYYAPILYNNLQFQLLYPPNFVNQTYYLSIAAPKDIQTLFVANPSLAGQGAYTITKTLKDPSAQEWNLTIEQSIDSNTLLTLGYIGDVSRHGSARADFNQPFAAAPGSAQLTVKPNPLLGPTEGQLNAYSANYNGLIASLSRRYSNGLQFLVSYTWSKSMSILDADNGIPQTIYHPEYDYAPASFDRTHNLLLSAVYDLPFGPGRKFATSNNWFNRAFVGGWQLSGVQQFATGQPISISANNNADTSYLHPEYADKVCDPTSGFSRSKLVFYNAACFTQPAVGQYGNARDSVRIPGLDTTNISLLKGFQLTERHQVQFRADAFSIFNHPNLWSGGDSVTDPTPGLLNLESVGSRVLQFELRYSF